MLRTLTRPNGVTRWIATTLVLAITATLWPATAWASIGTSDLQEGPAPAFTPVNPPTGGSGPRPRAAGANSIGPLSTVPSYDDSLDDGYLSRWDGKPTLFLSPNADNHQDTVTLSWFEPFEGKPEIPGDPGDPEADPPIPPKDPVPAIPPGADTSVWIIVPPRQAGEAERQMELMPVRRVGPGTVTFQWDGTIPGGWNVDDGWYYWYTKRTDPETGEETTSALGRIVVDRGVTELRKVLTQESSPGSLEIRVQAHDERSGIKTIKARILDGSTEVYSSEYTPPAPAWRWWPDQEFAHFNWPVANLDRDYTLEVTLTDLAGNQVTEPMPLWPPVNRTGVEAFWPLADGKVLGQEFSVDPASGNLDLTSLDLQLPDVGPGFSLLRSYNHQRRVNGLMGWGFSLGYEERIEKDKIDNSLIYTDPDGSIHTFQRSGKGGVMGPPGLFYHLEVIPDANGRDESYRLTHKNGVVTEFNIHGRPVEKRDKNGNAITFEYIGVGYLGKVTDASGRSLVFTYESEDALIKGSRRYAKLIQVEEELPDGPGRKVQFEYNEKGELVRAVDLAGVETLFGWDNRHRVTSFTVSRNGEPRTISLAYDSHNALARISGTRGDGITETWRGSMSWQGSSVYGGSYALSDPLGSRTYRVNGSGNLTSLSLPEGGTWAFSYSNNLLRSKSDPLGHTTSYGYDSRGNLTSVAEPDADPTVFVYNSDDDLESVSDPLGRTTYFGYDGSRNLTRVTDARGAVTRYAYYDNGLLHQTTQPGGLVISYAYDEFGNLDSRADSRSTTVYAYDRYGNQTSAVTDEVGGSGTSVISTTYDDRGNPLEVVDANDVVTAYEYDENGNRTRITVSGAGTGVTETNYVYDASFNLCSVLESETVTDYRYDASGHRTRMEVRAPGGASGSGSVSSFIYDRDGRLKTETNSLNGVTTYGYDLAGRRTSVRNPVGTTTYAYDARGNVTLILEPEGKQTTHVYDDANQKRWTVEGTEPDVRITTYTYDDAGNPETVTYPDGSRVRYTYDLDGNRVAEEDFGPAVATTLSTAQVQAPEETSGYDTAGVQVLVFDVNQPTGADEATAAAEPEALRRQTFTYDAFGQLIASTDGEGHTTTYGYDYLGNQTRVTDPTGVTTSYVYDAGGRLLQEANASGLVRHYGYDHLGNTLYQSDQAGTWNYTYDRQGRMLSVSDPTRGVTNYTYDYMGNRRTVSQAMGDGRTSTRTYSYDKAGNVTVEWDGENNVAVYQFDGMGRRTLERREGLNGSEAVETSFEYDGLSRLVKTVDAKGNEAVTEYDTFGDRVATYDPAAPDVPLAQRHRTGYEYDLQGRLLAVTDALGNTTRHEYDPLGNQTAVVDARGGATRYDYDKRGLVKAIRKVLDDNTVYATSFTYDNAGRQLTMTDANGHTRRSEYDKAGRLSVSHDALGNPTHFEYDVFSQRAAVVDPLSRRTEFAYDALGRTTSERDPLGQVRSYRYDPAGNLSAEVDALGGETQYAYDRNFRQVAVTDPRGLTDHYIYDGLGNRLSWTNARDLTTDYAYDPRNNLTQVTEPASDGGTPAVTLHGYNELDHHVVQQDPAGRQIEYRYDAAGRLTAEISGALALEYGYDEVGNRTSVTDARGTTTYAYDLLGRVSQVQYPNGEVESFTYDGVGNVLTKTDGTGTTIYTYDPNDRVSTVTDPTGTTVGYQYDAAGTKTGETIDGQPTSAEYDAAGRTTGYTDTLGFRYAYAYDPDNRLTLRSGPSFGTSLAYNEAGRVTRVTTTASVSGGTGAPVLDDAQYTYNERNFVSTVMEDGRHYEYRYDSRDQITEIINPSGDLIRYTFDGAGNRVRREAVINGAEKDLGQKVGIEELIKMILDQVKAAPGAEGQPGGASGAGGAGDSKTTPGNGKGGGVEKKQSNLGPGGWDIVAWLDSPTPLLAAANDKTNPGNGHGNDDAPGQNKDGKVTGRDNALLRGKGLKKGLLRKFQADEQGIVGNILEILERIVNGETHVPPGNTAGLEKTVRQVAAGYTIVGQEFEYNDLNQLVSVHDPIRDETFNYAWDEAGALIQTGNADLTWDERGRLTELVWADGDGIAFTYDAQGRRLSKTTFNHQGQGRQTTTFHYLAGTNQLLYEEGPEGRLDYTYDSQGHRLTISHDGETYWYIYNGHGDVVGLVDAQGTLAARYEYDDYGRIVHMWGTDGQEVREGQGQIHHLNGDVTVDEVSPDEAAAAQGPDATLVTDDAAAPATETSPKSKGKGQAKKAADSGAVAPDASADSAAAVDLSAKDTLDAAVAVDSSTEEIVKINPYRYASYRYDWETELYFLESRYYDSWSNRFVSRDSYYGIPARPLTLNRYVYAVNNSLEWMDPNGQEPLTIRGGGNATIGEIVTCLANGYIDCRASRKYAQLAADETARRYPPSRLHNSQGDACRHAYWNALMVAKISDADIARQVATKHEQVHPPGDDRGLQMEQTMDLYNNRVGRLIGQGLKGSNKTEEQIADAVEMSVNRGDLLMIHMPRADSGTWEFWWTDGSTVTWIGTTPTHKPGGRRQR